MSGYEWRKFQKQKKQHGNAGFLIRIYWPVWIGAYLFFSFTTEAWRTTWIAIVFAAIFYPAYKNAVFRFTENRW